MPPAASSSMHMPVEHGDMTETVDVVPQTELELSAAVAVEEAVDPPVRLSHREARALAELLRSGSQAVAFLSETDRDRCLAALKSILEARRDTESFEARRPLC